MDKKTWAIVGVIAAVFIAIIMSSVLSQSSVDYSSYDLDHIIPADENTGNLPENIIGDPSAPVIIYEYGDYQCTACAPIAPYINEIVDEYDGQVAVVLRTYIMDYHQNGTAAASAANAAAIQGYWRPYKDLLFNKQNDWYYSDANQRQQQFEQYFLEASSGKGDLDKFREDMRSPAVSKKISFDQKIAERVDIEWTPTFYLSGELIDQREMKTEEFLQTLRDKIDAELKAQGIEKQTKKTDKATKSETKSDSKSNSDQKSK